MATSSTFCLVSDDPQVELAVRRTLSPSDALRLFSATNLVDERRLLSPHGKSIVEASMSADALLLEMQAERAPELNTVSFHVREKKCAPIVMLCGGGAEERAAAIAAGADLALSFPLSGSELRAIVFAYRRLRSALVGDTGGDVPSPSELRFGALHLNRPARRFYVGNEEVVLTPREFRLLEFLIESAGEARTRDQILDAVWGIHFDTGTNMVDVYMYFLRRKLEAFGLKNMIETVRGFGYRLTSTEV